MVWETLFEGGKVEVRCGKVTMDFDICEVFMYWSPFRVRTLKWGDFCSYKIPKVQLQKGAKKQLPSLLDYFDRRFSRTTGEKAYNIAN